MAKKHEHINYKVERDFGQVYGDSFKFLRQNFGKFFKTVLFITGPFMLIASITYGMIYSGMLSGMFRDITSTRYPLLDLEVISIEFIIYLLSAIIAHIFLIGSVIHFMKLYEERGRIGFDVDDVWKSVIRDFWRFLGTFLGLFLIYFILALVLILVVVVFAMIPVAGVLFALLAVIGMFILAPPVMYQAYSVYLIRGVERIGFFDAVGRSFKLLKGSFWWTWLIMIVAFIATYILSIVFFIPMYIVMMIITFHSISSGAMDDFTTPLLVTMSIAMFFSMLIYCIPLIIMSFHHFSLVEKKEGTGMMEMIDELGKTPDDDVEASY